MKTAANLQERIRTLIGRGVQCPTADAEFNELALAVFTFQFGHNESYRSFCRARRQTPQSVRHWKEVPAVPTVAFKEFTLTCFPPSEAVAVFHTSGTTQGRPGKHFFRTLELYEAAIIPNFQAHLLPELYCSGAVPVPGFRQQQQRTAVLRGMRLFILTPSPAEAPRSSLSHMMGVVEKMMGKTGRMQAEDSFFVRDGRLETERLARSLGDAEKSGETVMLLGTAFAFVHLFEFCEQEQLRFKLAEGSRAMETGGFKGKSRAMSKPQLYAMFERFLGIPPSRVVNEYGMTELSTQFYDMTLRRKSETRNANLKKNPRPEIQNQKSVPPWARVMIVDPQTGGGARAGERGLIRVFDLANLYSVMAVQTEDIGVAVGDGFEVLGRATGAEARGCSIALDEMLGTAPTKNANPTK